MVLSGLKEARAAALCPLKSGWPEQAEAVGCHVSGIVGETRTHTDYPSGNARSYPGQCRHGGRKVKRRVVEGREGTRWGTFLANFEVRAVWGKPGIFIFTSRIHPLAAVVC